MVSYKTLLIISIIVGIIVAAFPLYVDYIRKAIPFGVVYNKYEEEYTISGKIQAINIAQGILVVDGKNILFKGWWYDDGESYHGTDLLTKLKVGDKVTIYCTYSEKWGYMAEKIVMPNGKVFERD